MKGVTVLIPTANRPALLEGALRSVAGQTDLSLLQAVVVSENGGTRGSEAVCRSFAGVLPVEYLYQEPPLSPVGHWPRLFSLANSEYAALLCDDDWWMAGHLQNALAALDAVPTAAAAFSTPFFAESELGLVCEIYKPAPLAAAAAAANHLSWWNLSTTQTLAAAWLCTPFHFSSVVARSAPLRAAGEALATAHPNCADRLLEARLSLEGPLLFYPQPTVGVRIHAGNYRSGKSALDLHEADVAGMEQIDQLARGRNIDLPGVWRDLLLQPMPPEYRNEVANRFCLLLGGAGLRRLGLYSALFPSPAFAWMKLFSRHFAAPLKPWVPPALLSSYRRARRKAADWPAGPKKVAKSGFSGLMR